MGITFFDDITRHFSVLPSRRDVLRGLAATGLGVGFAGHFKGAEAKRKPRHKKNKKNKKIKRNAFGCVNVGAHCKNSAQCCSGICEGKKDKRKCVAHDTGICIPGSNVCKLEGVAECHPSNSACHCVQTTGKATFCGDTGGTGDGPASLCRVCSKDTDCEPEFGSGAACVIYEGLCSIYCAETGNTACVPPCA